MARVHDQIPELPQVDRWASPQAAYEAGYHGCFGNHEDCPTWMRRVAAYDRNAFINAVGDDRWEVESVFPTALVGTGTGKKSLNHLHIMEHIPTAFNGNQAYGNCRAWSMRFNTQSIIGMAIANGDVLRTDHRHGTALVYGSRQSSQQGMTMDRGCEVVTKIGQSEEKDYGFVNLSTQRQDEDAGNKWGSSKPPQELVDACTGDQMERAYHVSRPTAQIVKDLLYNESVLDTGSTLTGGGTGNPLVGLKTIGGHAQACTGYDDTDECRAKLRLSANECVIFMQQSWGPNWIQVNNWPEDLWGPRPEGCWPITMSNFLKLVGQWNDTWAIVGAKGFVARRLPDWGSKVYL